MPLECQHFGHLRGEGGEAEPGWQPVAIGSLFKLIADENGTSTAGAPPCRVVLCKSKPRAGNWLLIGKRNASTSWLMWKSRFVKTNLRIGNSNATFLTVAGPARSRDAFGAAP